MRCAHYAKKVINEQFDKFWPAAAKVAGEAGAPGDSGGAEAVAAGEGGTALGAAAAAAPAGLMGAAKAKTD
jgi:hypothetical protein